MSIVVDISISLDGFVTGPNAGVDNGLGDGGERLHTWAFSDDADDQRVIDSRTFGTGAVVMGRRLFDIVDKVWNDEVGYGAGHAAEPPCFVVTHTVPDEVRLDRMTIVTDGIVAALDQARAVAGDKEVVVMGGGDLCGQVLALGLADELSLHVAPLILGAGSALFQSGSRLELEHIATISTPNAEHVRYRLH